MQYTYIIHTYRNDTERKKKCSDSELSSLVGLPAMQYAGHYEGQVEREVEVVK